MKKYNLSNIMKAAWKLVKEAGKNMSEALKAAWAEAKGVTVEALEEKLQLICDECNKKYPGVFEILVKKDTGKLGNNVMDTRFHFYISTKPDPKKIASNWYFGYFHANTKTYVPVNDNIYDFKNSVKSIIG